MIEDMKLNRVFLTLAAVALTVGAQAQNNGEAVQNAQLQLE